MLPGMRDFDGVRHFLEFYPPMALLAAMGLRSILGQIGRCAERYRKPLRALDVVGSILPCAIATARTHPNGICYFNFMVGGLEGAQARGDLPQATDYWGNSYWQGADWLNEHAEPGASLIVPVARHVVRSVASVKLRKDLQLLGSSLDNISAPLYVMYITRKVWYGPFVHRVESRMPEYEIRVQGGINLKIVKMADAEAAKRAAALLDRETRSRGAVGRLSTWILAEPKTRFVQIAQILQLLRVSGREETERRLKALLPVELHADAGAVVWLISQTK